MEKVTILLTVVQAEIKLMLAVAMIILNIIIVQNILMVVQATIHLK